MYEHPRQRALRQFAALLDLLTEMAAAEERHDLTGAMTVSEITTPRDVSTRRQRVRPELQAWVCRHYRWLVGVLMFQLVTVVALVVAFCG
jgi:hypothetical protein